ncbi:hypothetical protein GALMADRAFT_261645 [Galerina marginata CBS 339.88]|uniref:Uncharacterized protein n=1 Tax=Galerina marginata (strain CBS 339.88) TaxID=685588 RepID=A0A067TUN9_GALM3|nr:hypothetical protein GALMADRAFT_261645 [Galerina marginata CBS 339.88]
MCDLSFTYRHEDGTEESLYLGPHLCGPDVDPKKRLYHFKPMPAIATTDDRFYFLGWPITAEELAKFGKRWRKKGIPSRDPFYLGCTYLKAASGFMHLQTVLVEPQTEREKMDPENKDGLGFVMLWVNEAERFHRIPTQGQVDRLVEILKREPEWYRDLYESEDFDMHNLP